MFLLWLRQLPRSGDRTPASVPPPSEGRSNKRSCFFPLVPSPYRVLHGSIYSFPMVRSSCPLSAGVLHALLCLKVCSWCIRGEWCTPCPPTPPPDCSLFSSFSSVTNRTKRKMPYLYSSWVLSNPEILVTWKHCSLPELWLLWNDILVIGIIPELLHHLFDFYLNLF